MMRLRRVAIVTILTVGPQDKASLEALVKRFDSADWVEQAQAAKLLVAIGKPSLKALSKVSSGD